MLQDLRALLGALKGFRSSLPRGIGARVLAADRKAAAKTIVDTYFRNVRPFVLPTALAKAEVCDEEMQELLALANRQGSVSKYKSVTKAIMKLLVAIEGIVVAGAAAQQLGTVDQRILEALRLLPLPGAAFAYEQALRDLEGVERLSWRGPATDLRESLRETLDHLAPDELVISQPGFTVERDQRGPTMKQKTKYVLQSRTVGDSERAPAENAAEAVDEILGKFVRSVYTRSAISTHTPTSRDEVARVRELVRVALCEILDVR